MTEKKEKGFIIICGSCGRQNTFTTDCYPMKERDHWDKENITVTMSAFGSETVEIDCVCKNSVYYEKD
jgi:hypothetical protein